MLSTLMVTCGYMDNGARNGHTGGELSPSLMELFFDRQARRLQDSYASIHDYSISGKKQAHQM